MDWRDLLPGLGVAAVIAAVAGVWASYTYVGWLLAQMRRSG